MMRIHERGSPGYDRELGALARRGEADLSRVEPDVRVILDAVRARGDAAVLELAARFDGRAPASVCVPESEWRREAANVSGDVRGALAAAGDRIRRYHEHQRDRGFSYEEDGIRLGLRIRPVASAGVYAPGGKARYPSSVL